MPSSGALAPPCLPMGHSERVPCGPRLGPPRQRRPIAQVVIAPASLPQPHFHQGEETGTQQEAKEDPGHIQELATGRARTKNPEPHSHLLRNPYYSPRLPAVHSPCQELFASPSQPCPLSPTLSAKPPAQASCLPIPRSLGGGGLLE